MQSMNFELHEDGAFVELTVDKVKHVRHVTIPDLIDCLNRSIGKRVEDELVVSPILPQGTIGYISNQNDPEDYVLVMFQHGYRGSVGYESRVFEDVGLPSSVFRFHVKNKTLIQTNMWALPLNTKFCRPDLQLYHYPFYNVSSGRLCMGANHITFNEPWELFKAPEIIRAMPSTRAYAFRNNSGLDGDSLFRSLTGKDFPDEWLTPADITLGKIIERS